ncbi:hypothetical protein [Lishizhenia sp.]|uniref:hypothetical protein n=1 Tax=Lishizhenia sp. TaxID=2497594 RepID=UPI00299EFFF7|nr:hypothetical protein [Lishizhenia sp.]MDX1445335.1 hypothetical protein [Lishizhenia sp.]
MTNNKLGYFILLLLSVGFVFSCKKETFEVDNLDLTEADPSFAIPLAKATLNLGDLEKEFDVGELIYNENDELFRLVYGQNLFEFDAGELIDLPSQNLNYDVTVPPSTASAFALAPAGSSVNFSETLNENFAFSNGEEVDSIRISSGALNISAYTDMQHDVTLNISIPYLKQNGVAYSSSIDLSYQGSTPTEDIVNLDLANYVLDLSKNGQTNNELEVNVEVTLTKTGQPYLGSESIGFDMELQLGSFESIWGYFGNFQNIVAQDTQSLPVFTNYISGDIHFADPQLNLYLRSSAGLPLGINFTGLYDVNSGSSQSLGGPGLTNIPTIPGASFIGDTAEFFHSINNSNTTPSLSELIDASPNQIVFELGAETNPDGVAQNFLTGNASVSGDIEVILPIYGYASNFSFQDTSDLDLEEALDLDTESNFDDKDIESATIRIISDNGLPLALGAQVYFLDENYVVLDSLFEDASLDNLIPSGVIDNSLPVTDPNFGKVIANTRRITDVKLDSEQLQSLISQGTRKVVYRANLNTSDADQMQDVKFYPEYELTVTLSAKINFNVNLSN